MLVCVPTMPGFDDFEIEAKSAAEAYRKAEAYCRRDKYNEGVKIDYSSPVRILDAVPDDQLKLDQVHAAIDALINLAHVLEGSPHFGPMLDDLRQLEANIELGPKDAGYPK